MAALFTLSFSLHFFFYVCRVVVLEVKVHENCFWLFLTTENKTNSKLSDDANRILFVWFYNCLYVLIAQSFRSQLLYMGKLKHLSDLMVLFVLVIIIFILLFVIRCFSLFYLKALPQMIHCT